jgi:heme-degrading monooxygenase HmoA
MFIRVTRIENSPDRVEQGIATYKEQVVPQARTMAGFAGAILLVDRSSGAAASVTFWESEDAMRASEARADTIRTQTVQTGGGRLVEVDRFELVMQERSAPPQANTFTRVNDVQGSPERLEDAIRFMREEGPRATKQLRGFRALLMAVNRQSGRFLVSSVWESASDRDASNAAVSDLRRRLGQIAGAERVDLYQYEVAFAEVSQAAAAGTR